ncbi:uncharacterized protein [Diadema antillarum]|uniref:uncharacterized protein n=1 Tax=Diadema antillarum TaxID=105358 RepID=UPI003A841F13
MSLTLTEAWIRERVQLTHDNLEDVRSLSLPGTYQEKIANLGNALASFSRLKQLDLSRNALQSLQGLQFLTLLEKLNLYYNNVSTLQELSRLRHNTSLQELDLRLNPVTKNEPDYRLYLVHMLPNLRKLDDRSVRESERKSALLHFDTDQATSMTEHAPSPARETRRSELPRTKHVRGLVGRSVIEDDDSDLLDLLARTDGDLSKPRPITGSASGLPSVDVQSSQDYPRLYSQRTPPHRSIGHQAPSGQFTERDRGSYHTDIALGTVQAANTSLASDSTGSLLDMDPLDPLGDSFHSTHLSPAKPSPPKSSPPLAVRDPLTTLHDDPPSPTDTNTLVEEITRSISQTWQPSDSLLKDRKAFEVEHRDLLSPSDTISLMGDGITDFGNARLSFSPLEGRRKLDFAGDSPNTATSKETVTSPSGVGSIGQVSPPHSVSTFRSDFSLSELSDVDYAELPRIPASQREKGPIKAGDIYSSIRLQTLSRAKALSQTTVLTSSPDGQGTNTNSSPLAKESKKSVSFLLGDVADTRDPESDKLNSSLDKLEKLLDLTSEKSMLEPPSKTGTLKTELSNSNVSMGSPSKYFNSSRSNEIDLIHTSALISTPQEDRYSGLVIGTGRRLGKQLFTDDTRTHTPSTTPLKKSSILSETQGKDLKTDALAKLTDPKAENRNTAASYSFSLHDDSSLPTSCATTTPLRVSPHTLIRPLHSSKSNLHASPPRPTHPSSLSLSATVSVSPTLTDITTASSATNTSRPSATVRGNPLVDQPPIPDSPGAGRAAPHPVAMSDTSLHHVHHLLTPSPEPSQHLPDAERSQRQQGHQRSRVEVDSRGRVDPNLRFTDEDDAYTAFSSKVNFTPNPKSTETLSSSSYDMHPSSGSGDRSGDTYSEPPPVQRVSTKQNATSAPGPAQSTFMDSLLGLVDRYWNGSKSLHAHSKFQAQAHGLLEKLLAEVSTTSQEQLDRLQLDVARYAQENVALRSKLGPAGRAPSQAFGGADLQTALDKAQKEVELLRRELQDTMAQNRDLQSQLVESRTRSSELRNLSHTETRGDVSGEGEKLKVENDKLKLQLKHFTQLQELATMLQESHKSLVTTNDHLLKELEETKQRHLEEVKQLHWSYSQLKQTVDISSLHTPSHTPVRANAHSASSEGSPPGGGYSPGKKVRGFSYSNGTM